MNSRISPKSMALLLSMVSPLLYAQDRYLPVLNEPLDVLPISGSESVDLNTVFGMEVVDPEVVRFTTGFSSGGNPITVEMAIFSNRTPVTRTNFLQYVSDGDYVDSFIHRAVTGFVLQGGGFGVDNGSLTLVPTDPEIVNEFGISNTRWTISMAKTAASPDSATSQWFISVGENSANLDYQNGGFTVFGRVVQSNQASVSILANPSNFPPTNYSNVHPALTQVPASGGASLITFDPVTLEDLDPADAGTSTALTYSVVSNSDSTAYAVGISGNTLNITPGANASGATTVTIRATDSVGNTVDDTFVVKPGFDFDAWSNAEYGGSSTGNADPEQDGVTNFELFLHGLNAGFSEDPTDFLAQEVDGSRRGRFSFDIRNDVPGLEYEVERTNDLQTGNWQPTATHTISRVRSGDVDQLTIQEVTSPNTARSFYRVRFTGP